MNIPPYGDEYRKLFGNMATLSPSAQDAPNMTVRISAGGFWSYLDGVSSYVEYVGGSSPVITAPGSNAKWVAVTLNSSGMVVNIDGTASANPVPPAIPRNRYPIALAYVRSGDVKLTNEYIFDIRPVFQNPVRSHSDLMNLTDDGAHPTSAITGLDALIATLATLTNLNDGLADKADTGGTTSASFKLNQDQTGTPSSDATIEVERGDSTNVKIRWNETTDNWQYTNDGATWVDFADLYLNDGTQALLLKTYSQDAEPTLSDTNSALWIDTNDSNRVYLVFKPTGLTQVKVELT